MTKNRRRTQKRRIKRQSQRQTMRIDVLPNDVLLEIFAKMDPSNADDSDTDDSDADDSDDSDTDDNEEIGAWQSLVHVCRRWRGLVFESPRRLNLQIRCTPEAPLKDTLDVWPALPVAVEGSMQFSSPESSSMKNVIAGLEQSNRVCKVDLWNLAGWQLEKVLAAMQVPFPELTDLELFSDSDDETLPVIPDSFLDGSAPRLRNVDLKGILFPGLPKLLSSATHLFYLGLRNIPHSGYISPKAMVTILSVLSRLETLELEFKSPQSRYDWKDRILPPSNRFVLPVLDHFRFKGAIEYLEDLVTFIDAPLLDCLCITSLNQIGFDTPQLAQFINSTPALKALDEARVEFDDNTVTVGLQSRTSESGSSSHRLYIATSCGEPNRQLSSVAQVCNSLSPLSMVEDLYIEHKYYRLVWNDRAIENIFRLWLRLLHPFTAVKNLYLSQVFAPGIADALQELIGARITEVLPSLQTIFVERIENSYQSEYFERNIWQFVGARRQSCHPIAISFRD